QKAFEKYNVGTFSFGNLSGNEAATSDIDEHIKRFQLEFSSALTKGNIKVQDARESGNIGAVKSAENELFATVKRLAERELVDYVYPSKSRDEFLSKSRGSGIYAVTGQDTGRREAILSGFELALKEVQRAPGDRAANAALTGQKDQIEAQRANTEAAIRLQEAIDRYNNKAQGPGAEFLRLTSELEKDLKENPSGHGRISTAFQGAFSFR